MLCDRNFVESFTYNNRVINPVINKKDQKNTKKKHLKTKTIKRREERINVAINVKER